MVEAKSEAKDTVIAQRGYRGDSSYEVATIRKNWTQECYPHCS